MPRIPVKELHIDALFQETRPAPEDGEGASWSFEVNTEYSGSGFWECWEAARCDGCGKVTNAKGMCETQNCPSYGEHDDTCEGPMMNYWYPLGETSTSYYSDSFDPDKAARKLVDVPLCVVQVSGEYGLALTGGGMDLTWEIMEAFTLLGYLPPLSHCVPPRFAGMKLDAKRKYLLAAGRQSIFRARTQLTYKLEEIERTRAWLRAGA